MKKIVVLFVGIGVLATWILAAEKEAEKSPSASATASSSTVTATHKVFATASDLKWVDVPPGLPSGAKMAVLYGDPTKSGAFTVRISAPAGYVINPHTHPTTERLTVVTGALRMGMGEKMDESAMQEIGSGGYFVLPTGMAHFVKMNADCVVQIDSEGPFEIKYVRPADDPRNAKK